MSIDEAIEQLRHIVDINTPIEDSIINGPSNPIVKVELETLNETLNAMIEQERQYEELKNKIKDTLLENFLKD